MQPWSEDHNKIAREQHAELSRRHRLAMTFGASFVYPPAIVRRIATCRVEAFRRTVERMRACRGEHSTINIHLPDEAAIVLWSHGRGHVDFLPGSGMTLLKDVEARLSEVAKLGVRMVFNRSGGTS